MGGLAALALAGLLAAAQPQVSVPFRTLARDDQGEGAYRSSRTLVVRDATRWRRVWSRLDTGERRPRVDFGGATVVVLTQGVAPSGSSVRVKRVERTARGLTVHAKRVSAGSCTGQGGTVTPYHAISIPRTDLPVAVEIERVSRACE